MKEKDEIIKKARVQNEICDCISRLVKYIFTVMFQKQEQKVLDIIQNGSADTSSQIDRITQGDSNTTLDVSSKEAAKLK